MLAKFRPILPALLLALAALALFHGTVWVSGSPYWENTVWDEGYYVGIARAGYPSLGVGYLTDSALPFSPGYPLLLRMVASVLGADPLSVRVFLSGFLFVLTCLGIWQLLRGFVEDRMVRIFTLAGFCTWPGSLYFVSAYAEALYMPLLVWFLVALQRRIYSVAAVLGAAALFTRSPAVILAPTLFLAMMCHSWLDSRVSGNRRLGHLARTTLRGTAYGAIIGLGLVGYMIIQYVEVGDPLAWIKSYAAWNRIEHTDLHYLSLESPYLGYKMFPNYVSVQVSIVFFVAMAPLVFFWRNHLPLELFLFCGVGWLFFLQRQDQMQPFIDTLRWSAVFFPVHYCVMATIDVIARSFGSYHHMVRNVASVGLIVGQAVVYVHLVLRYITGEWVS